MVKIAIIRIRGFVRVKRAVTETTAMLGLGKKNSCAVVELTPIVKGMLSVIENHVTWGEVSEDTIKVLEEKRGKRAIKNDFKTIYFLNSPRKGFDRKGIKKSYTVGGALGYRGDAINELLSRMV